MKSKLISISAISAGLSAIALTVGAYIEFTDVFALIISSVFVLMPLYYKSYKASLLAYLAGGVIAFLFSGFNIMSIIFPSYFLFFGIYPLFASITREKKLKPYIRIIIGLIWCIAYAIGLYYYYYFIMNMPFGPFPAWAEWFINNIIIVLIAFGGIFYFVYDRFIVVVTRVINYYLQRIVK